MNDFEDRSTPDKSNKKDKRFKATTPAKRFMKLAGMSASIAKNYANHKVKGMFADEEQKKLSEEQLYADIGKRIAQTLGEMKGAVMKVGQIASQVKDLLPKEVAEALEVLQKESPAMPYDMIRRQVIKSLGDDPENLFAHFDHEPFAAASIGQVHKAVTKEGVECVVKIQYPGVKESCESDLKHLRRALKLAGLVKVSDEIIEETFSEIKRTLFEELDYENEGKNVQFFHEYYKDHPKIETPQLIESLSTDKILTLTFVEGDSIKEVKAPRYSQETINELGILIFDTIGRQIYHLKKVHSDPHPGNFAFRPDGTFIIYDFGAVKSVKEEVLTNYRALVKDALDGNIDTIDQHLHIMGVRTPNSGPIDNAYYQEWMDIIMEPFSSNSPFNFGESRLHKQAAKKVRKEAFKYLGYFQPSPDTMQVDRVLTGHYWTMVELGVNAAFRPLIDEIILEQEA
ncbi:MAG: AarF/ABC1/UbiB kinase family protein [Pseudomonadales bacterium]|nr:AarF/ABC1/UbiB kinase family protein [Pseudomonadales bacterium]